MQDEQRPGIFEPDAESIPAEALARLQADRLRSLIDRLIAAGGVQASGSGRLASAPAWTSRWRTCRGCR